MITKRAATSSLPWIPCFVLLAVALAATPSAAVDVELTPMIGFRSNDYELRQDLVCITIYEECSATADGQSGEAFGVVLGFDLRPDWQLELLANRQESEVETETRLIAPPGTGVPDVRFTEDADFEATHLQVGVSRTWGESTVRPFLGAAVGTSRVEIAPVERPQTLQFPSTEFPFGEISEDALSASVGGGIKAYFSPRIGVRLAARGYWVDLPEEAGSDFTQAEAGAGLILRF